MTPGLYVSSYPGTTSWSRLDVCRLLAAVYILVWDVRHRGRHDVVFLEVVTDSLATWYGWSRGLGPIRVTIHFGAVKLYAIYHTPERSQ